MPDRLSEHGCRIGKYNRSIFRRFAGRTRRDDHKTGSDWQQRSE